MAIVNTQQAQPATQRPATPPAPPAAQPARPAPPATPWTEAQERYKTQLGEVGVAATMLTEALHKLGPVSREMREAASEQLRRVAGERNEARKEVERLRGIQESLIERPAAPALPDRPVTTERLEVALNSLGNLITTFEPGKDDRGVATILASLEGIRATMMRVYQWSMVCDTLENEPEPEPAPAPTPDEPEPLWKRLGALASK